MSVEQQYYFVAHTAVIDSVVIHVRKIWTSIPEIHMKRITNEKVWIIDFPNFQWTTDNLEPFFNSTKSALRAYSHIEEIFTYGQSEQEALMKWNQERTSIEQERNRARATWRNPSGIIH